MDTNCNKRGRGTMGGKLRPHDPGKSQVPLVLPDQTPTMDADDDEPLSFAIQNNVLQENHTFSDIYYTLNSFISEAILIIHKDTMEIYSFESKIEMISIFTTIGRDFEIPGNLRDQRKPLLEKKIKLLDKISMMKTQFDVKVKDLKSKEDLSEYEKEKISITYERLEDLDREEVKLKRKLDVLYKSCEFKIWMRLRFMEKNQIKDVPASRDFICDSSQLSYNVVEKPSEKFSKVVREAPILHASKSYDGVEIEIVQNFPQKELKLRKVIYINAPADIMYLDEQQFEEIDSIFDLKVKSGCAVQYLIDCNRKTDANEEWKKKIDTKCESGKLLNVDFSLGQDLEAQEIYGSEDILKLIGFLNLELTYNLKNLDMVYITPELYSWDVHNEPSSRLFSLWFVYDRGKIDFYV